MKLADSTIYNDGDLSIPYTENSIICANMLGSRIRSFYVATSTYQTPSEYYKMWRSNDREIPLALDNLQDIVIIYRAPADGTKGPELIEDLYDIKEDEYDDEYLEEKLDSLKRTLNRGVEKIVGIARVILEEN